jgi:hypothetical protein
MCCDPTEVHRARGTVCCETDCCCTPRLFARRFVSAKEKQERLEAYRDQLEKEIAGVQDRIQELNESK